MVLVRGNRTDYDGWAEAGNAGWDFHSVLPLFKKSEDWEDGESKFRGDALRAVLSDRKFREKPTRR